MRGIHHLARIVCRLLGCTILALYSRRARATLRWARPSSAHPRRLPVPGYLSDQDGFFSDLESTPRHHSIVRVVKGLPKGLQYDGTGNWLTFKQWFSELRIGMSLVSAGLFTQSVLESEWQSCGLSSYDHVAPGFRVAAVDGKA